MRGDASQSFKAFRALQPGLFGLFAVEQFLKRFVAAAAFVGCAAGLGLAIRLGPLGVVEFLLIAGSIAALLAVRSAWRVIEAAPMAHRIVAGGLLLLFVTGHVAASSTKTFPFVTWRMFGGYAPVPETRYYRIEGVAPSGERYRISPERVWPPLRDFRFTDSYHLIASRRSQLDGVHRELIVALGRAYMRWKPGRRLARVEVFEDTVSLAAHDRHARAKREFIYGVDLE
jgi:hypothetical protein